MATGEIQSKRTAKPRPIPVKLRCIICGEELGKPGSQPAVKIGGDYRHKQCRLNIRSILKKKENLGG